ncbi:hypothetical protein GGI15_004611 [Coemansia interrupta]|uniref:Uncharacterized protein n=1 Tax=Coemansia interrupta TaxID=1126814 RepID=A0A9W8H2Y3_9FUNG|nr:hypothetical protein GGI15_004611 [Coemansia interrupta]
MSIPTIFSTANCQNSPNGSLGGGGMARFCRTFSEHTVFHDHCWIDTQEDYNEWQIGCVNYQWGVFVDNNNNTVAVEHKPGYNSYLPEAIEFPVGSHDNHYVLPAPHYNPPYPVFITQENCINTPTSFVHCCRGRPEWSNIETVAPNGTCVIMDDIGLDYFASCCVDVNKAHGTFINPLDGSTTTPEIPNTYTGLAPPYSKPTYGTSTTGDFWTESEYLATHTEEPYTSDSSSYEPVCTPYVYNESTSWGTCISDEDNEDGDSTDGLDSYTYTDDTSSRSDDISQYSSTMPSSSNYSTDSQTYSSLGNNSDAATSSYPTTSSQCCGTESSLSTNYSAGSYF